MRNLTIREWIYVAFASLFLLLLAMALGIPLGSSQFWIVLASWVQAVGSIGAIVAAIWIGQKQHAQNLQLVTDERERVIAEKDAATRDLRDAVLALLQPLFELANRRLVALEGSEGSVDPLPAEDLQAIEELQRASRHARESISEIRDSFVSQPLNLVIHGHLVRALQAIEEQCGHEIEHDRRRRIRAQQIAQAPFNRQHGQREAERPFRVINLRSLFDLLEQVYRTL